MLLSLFFIVSVHQAMHALQASLPADLNLANIVATLTPELRAEILLENGSVFFLFVILLSHLAP
jgi:hypothetical protein